MVCKIICRIIGRKKNISMLACLYKIDSSREEKHTNVYLQETIWWELFKATPFGVWGGPEKDWWFFTAHRLLSRIWAWLDGLSTYKSYNRNNDINMQKIQTVYCCEVEAVVGGGGLTPSRWSCPLILLISSSKLIWFSWIDCLRRGSLVWLKYLVRSMFLCPQIS